MVGGETAGNGAALRNGTRRAAAGVALACVLVCSSMAWVAQSCAETLPPLVGLVGTDGADVINQTTALDVGVTETTDLSETLGVEAIGIDALAGDDTVGTGGDGTVTVTAGATASVDIAIGRVETEAAGTGITTGDGADTTAVGAPITVTSTATTTTGEAAFLILEPGLTDGRSSAASGASGVVGGVGADVLIGNHAVTASATATTSLIRGELSAVSLPAGVLGLAEAPTVADARAVGLSVDEGALSCVSLFDNCTLGGGPQRIESNAAVSAAATATSNSADVTITLLGSERGDMSTHAVTAAAALLGSAGQDVLINAGDIDVDADASSSSATVAVKFPVVPLPEPPDVLIAAFGADLGDATTVAKSIAVGILGGDGDDIIGNHESAAPGGGDTRPPDVYAHAGVESTSVSVEIKVPTGMAAAATAEPGTVTGDGLTLTADGEAAADSGPLSVADVTTRGTATAWGLSGGSGDDTITNSGPLKAETLTNAVSTSITLGVEIDASTSGWTLPLGFSLSEAETAGSATTVGIAGGADDDTVVNSGALAAVAVANVISTAVDVQVNLNFEAGFSFDVGAADGSSRGTARATGLAGDGGVDDLTNRGSVLADASATVGSNVIGMTYSGTVEGVAGAGSLMAATSSAGSVSYGIDGGEDDGTGGDTIDNRGVVDAIAQATADAGAMTLTASFSGAGAATGFTFADADTSAHAHAAGARTTGGDDTVSSNGMPGRISATSSATSLSDAVAVTLTGSIDGIALGLAAARAATAATASAAGIETGTGDDIVANDAFLNSDATATSTSTSVAVTANIATVSAGAALAAAGTLAEATAVGIAAGDGADDVDNGALIDVDATASSTVSALSVNFSLAGTALADVGATASALAIGLDGGAGVDTLTNLGALLVDADATINASTTSVDLIGFAQADAALHAEAFAAGIVGGESVDNAAAGSIVVAANATAHADGLTVQGGGGEFAKLGSTTNAAAVGVETDTDGATVTNAGRIEVAAGSLNDAVGFGFLGAGVQKIEAAIGSDATATGIAARSGETTVTNDAFGSIVVDVGIDNLAGAVGAAILAFQLVGADADAAGIARGIHTNSAADHITNLGAIDVDAHVFNDAAAGAIGLFAVSSADALASATLAGVDAGDGDDVIDNAGSVSVGGDCGVVAPACVRSRAGSVAIDVVAFVDATLGARATFTGIAGGAGDDEITNFGTGTITVGNADPGSLLTYGETDSFALSLFTALQSATAIAVAGTDATGLDGGSGDDVIVNLGAVDVAARDYADAYAENDNVVGFLFGIAQSTATTWTNAVGIGGGEGNDTITNSSDGTVDVLAHARTRAETQGYVGVFNSIYADASSLASATGIGMHAGNGSNDAANAGAINVGILSEAQTIVRAGTDGLGGEAHSERGSAVLEASGWGMLGGSGIDFLDNTGSITVNAGAGIPATLALDIFAEEHVVVGPVIASNADVLPEVANPGVRVTASATGIAGAGGENTLSNAATTAANADAAAWAKAHNDSNERDTTADLSALSRAVATGMHSAGDLNTLANTGTLSVNALASGNLDVYSDSSYGADGDAWLRSEAVARGIQAELGYATITNTATGAVEVTAESRPHATAVGNSGWLGGWGVGRASVIGVADAVGLSAGDAGSRVDNAGTLVLAATVAPYGAGLLARSSGDDSAVAVGRAEASALGIETGAGSNDISHAGVIVIAASATSTVYPVGGGEYTNGRAYADASAIGIGAGLAAGNEIGNIVRNDGDIDVSAQASAHYTLWADADNKTGVAEATASAIGIATGGGDDVIHHTGSITTWERTTRLGVVTKDAPGTAIDTGAGNDTVYSSGVIHGAVRLESGDDALYVRSGQQLHGTADGGAGSDHLLFDTPAGVTGAPVDESGANYVNFERFTKTGAGIATIRGRTSLPQMTVAEGTLVLNGASLYGDSAEVRAGAVLAGTGHVALGYTSSVFVDPGATVSPGAVPGGIGTLSFGGDLFADRSIFRLDFLSTTSRDWMTLAREATLMNVTLEVNLGYVPAGDDFTDYLFPFDPFAGGFRTEVVGDLTIIGRPAPGSGVPVGTPFTVWIGNKTYAAHVVPVPPALPLFLSALAGILLARRRRR